MKQCGMCKVNKDLSEFAKDKNRKDGHAAKCKTCHKDLAKAHYQRNKATYAKTHREKKQKIQKHLQQLKEASPCTDCGEYYPYYVMQYDHLPQYEKSFHLGNCGRVPSVKRANEEIAKCQLVCANCHAVRTYERM